MCTLSDGLSFTTFSYTGVDVVSSTLEQQPLRHRPCDNFTVRFTVTNTGARAGAEVAQVYTSVPDARGSGIVRPRFTLAAVRRTPVLAPGASVFVSITLTARAASVVYNDGRRYVEAGADGTSTVAVHVGGSCPAGLAAAGVQTARFAVFGAAPLPLADCPVSAQNFG